MEEAYAISGLKHRIDNRWVVLFAAMLVQVSVSLLQQGFPALGPVLVDRFDLALPELGFVLASISWGVMISIYFWGQLADKIGERIVVVAGLGGTTLILLLAALQGSFIGLGVTLIAVGAFASAAVVSSGRAVSGRFSGKDLGLALGLRQASIPIGAVLAASMVPLIVWRFGLTGVFIGFATVSAMGAVVGFICFGRTIADRPPQQIQATQARPLKDPDIWRLSFASGLIQWSQVSLNSFIVVILVETQGIGLTSAVSIFAFIHIASAFGRIALGWWCDRNRTSLRDLACCAAAVAIAIGFFAVLLLLQSALASAALILATILSLSWNGLAITSLVELAGHAHVGSALGMFATLMRACTLPTAILFGWGAAALGWAPTLLLLALFPATGAALIWSLRVKRSRNVGGVLQGVPVQDQEQ